MIIFLFILIISLNQGLLSLLGVEQGITNLILILLLTLGLIRYRKYVNSNFYVLFLCFFIISLISFIINQSNEILFLIFIQRIFYYIFLGQFFIIIFKKNPKIIIKLNLFVKLFISYEAFISIIKIFTVGFKEDFIGSLSTSNGSLAASFPIFAMLLLLSTNGFKFNFSFFFFLIVSMIVPLTSLKRLSMFSVPLLLVLYYLLKNFSSRNIFLQLSKFSTLLFVTFLLFNIYIYFNPKVRTDTFDLTDKSLNQIFSYYFESESRDQNIDGRQISGRISALYLFSDLLPSNRSVMIGNGPGTQIGTSLVQSDRDQTHIDFGYGSRIGIYWILLQGGIFLLVLYFIHFKMAFRAIIRSKFLIFPADRPLSLYTILLIFFIIELFYSSQFYSNFASITLFSLIIAITTISYNEGSKTSR